VTDPAATSLIRDIAELIRAVAWPVFAAWTVNKFAPDIQKLLGRIKSAKFPGGSAEFDMELDQLGEKVDEAQAAVAAQPPPPQLPEPAELPPPAPGAQPAPAGGAQVPAPIVHEAGAATITVEAPPATIAVTPPSREQEVRSAGADPAGISGDIQAILLQASTSPKMALIQLAIEIETEMRRFLHATGWHKEVKSISPPVAIETLAGQIGVPQSLAESVKDFWKVRSKIVHGHGAPRDSIIRAIDLGVRILATLRQVPREVNVVYHPGTEVFADAEGKQLREGVRALVLKTTETNGKVWLRVFPTTKQDYKVGEQVAWEWSSRGGYGKSWYRHPDTGKIERAWDSSSEFVGRSLDSV
jgi:hypothetical protein